MMSQQVHELFALSQILQLCFKTACAVRSDLGMSRSVLWEKGKEGKISASPDELERCAGYLVQYTPSLGMLVMKLIGPGRAAQLKGGRSGYDVKSMLFGKSNDKGE